jgi:hypothetical protein
MNAIREARTDTGDRAGTVCIGIAKDISAKEPKMSVRDLNVFTRVEGLIAEAESRKGDEFQKGALHF